MARFTVRHFASTALAAAMLVAAAAPSMAQPAAPAKAEAASAPQAGKPGPRSDHHRGHGPRFSPEQREAFMAKRAGELKQKLKITADQEGAWSTFQGSMKPNEPKLGRLDRKEMEKLTTPERLDRMRAMRAERAAEGDRRAEAVKTFYATLKPEQQKVFDQESARMMHRFGPGEHGERGGPGSRDGGPRHHHGHDGKSHGHGPQGAQAPAAPAPAPAQ